MCLAVPARVDELEAANGWVQVGDARLRVSLMLTPEAGIGDWVLVHAGFAIQKIEEEAARATWQLLEEAASSMTEEQTEDLTEQRTGQRTAQSAEERP